MSRMRIGICVESSHAKGMGHLFRALNFMDYLNNQNESYVVFVNNDPVACRILRSKNIQFKTVNLSDFISDWESRVILQYGIDLWVNDRLNTDVKHSLNVLKNNIKLVTFDDRGSGAELADIHVASLFFGNAEELKGKKVLTGLEYLILNKEIDKYKRIRENINNIIVTLGGTDTYGVTLKVVEILNELSRKATIHLGLSFNHHKELAALINEQFKIIKHVPSLIKTFYDYDLAITGGGITPFEANVSGLPCLTISSEVHEIETCLYLKELGASLYLGHRDTITSEIFEDAFSVINLNQMSNIGISQITTSGVKNIMDELGKL